MPRFELGRLLATPGALRAIAPASLVTALQRHAVGDWGELSDEDRAANEAALAEGTRLLSAYTLDATPVWVITEGDRSATTVLLPHES